jgi:hypothetical protein
MKTRAAALASLLLLALAASAHAVPVKGWTKTFGGAGDDFPGATVVDAAGNILVAGYFNGVVNFNPGGSVDSRTSNGKRDCFLSKFAPDGTFLWVRTWGGANDDTANGLSTDSAGNAYVSGRFQATVDFDPGPGVDSRTSNAGLTANNIFLVKYDANGNYQWARAWGGIYGCEGYGCATDAGAVYIVGDFQGSANFNTAGGSDVHTANGFFDAFLAKYDFNGNFQWAKTWGGAGTIYTDGPSVAPDGLGHVYVAGMFGNVVTLGPATVDFDPGAGVDNHTSVGGQIDVFVSKFDTDGNFIWARTWGGAGNDCGSVLVAPAGDIFVSGYFADTVDFDPGPGVDTRAAAGGSDIFLSKLDPDGNVLWVKAWGGTGNDSAGFRVDGSGNIFAAGYFAGTVDFDPGTGVDSRASAGGSDAFLSKLDANGNFLWAQTWGGTGADSAYNIALDATGNVYVAGIFAGTVDFDPGAGVDNRTSNGVGDVLLVQFLTDTPVTTTTTSTTTTSTTTTSTTTSTTTTTTTTTTSTTTTSTTTTTLPPPGPLYVNDLAVGEAGSLCSAAGHDANDGLSPATPMRSIQALLAKYPSIGAGYILRVDPGTYPEVVTVTGHAGLKIRGAGADKCVVDGGQANTVFVLNSFGAGELSGLTIQNGKATGATALLKSGGGIRVNGASTALIANLILRNNAAGSGSGGGGIYTYYASPTLRNLLVANNTGTGCGGIRTYGGVVTITNCTVANNVGGGIHKTGTGTLAITNTIAWGNGDDLMSCAATYSCIEDGDAGTGNIAADPLFVNAAAGDFRLSGGSLCIDTADSAVAPATDLLGNARSDDATLPPNGSAFADMGAYEFQGNTQNDIVYVNDAATNEAGSVCGAPGNDANHGLSPRMPMLTIQGALNKYPTFGAGKTIRVDPGLYPENVNVVAAHAGLKILGAGAGKTALEGTSIVDGRGLNTVFILTNFGAGELSGFTILNGKATGDTALLKSGGGIRMCGASTALIADCFIRSSAAASGSGGGGIYTYNASPTIRNCVVVKNTGTGCGGIRTFGGAVKIMNCTVANNIGGGIHRTGTGTLAITNSIVWANGDDLMSCAATYSCIEDADAGTGNIAGNPLFINPTAWNYRLNAASPCIDAGTPTGAPPTDIDDIVRDATPDIGAYEWES